MARFCGTLKEIPYNGQLDIRGWIQKFPDWVDNELYACNNKYSLRSNTKGYGGKTH